MGNWLWALDTEHYRLCVGDGDEYHLSNKHALVAGTDRDGVGGDETSVYGAGKGSLVRANPDEEEYLAAQKRST